ncbi:Laccase-1 [Trachymyrmex septentrionalis]|uniref:Laccase-1 n=1 Tax=Trachymyrmex septentrionalis TaxID=34720 RepID=A0A195FQ48_9HYME|nr:Laccase-1 [Trachymyrmex septentrionalis]
MDGVPMITQCPILPFGGFRYKITPESTGTYFYHAHSVSQQGDGVYGSLVVRGLQDDDLSRERTLVFSSRSSVPLTRLRHASLSPPTPDELLVNGQAQQAIVRVKHGFRYLLRLINANAHDCPISLSAHGHSLEILAADGNPVQSMTGTHVVLFPGTRQPRRLPLGLTWTTSLNRLFARARRDISEETFFYVVAPTHCIFRPEVYLLHVQPLGHGLTSSETRDAGMEWTRDKTLELLREYQQRRVLWDWNARGYRDRTKRKRAIQELAEILSCNTLEVEKKITNLKCQYSREIHKIQNSRDAATGPDDVYVSKWFAFKAMQFLQFGTRRYSKRKKKVEEEPKLQEEYIVSNIDPESITFMDYNEETNGSGTGSFNASLSEDAEESSSSSMKAMELYNGSLPSQNGLESEQMKLELRPPDEKEQKKTKEEFAKFGESIAVQLAEIPDSYSRSVAKLRINQILFEAEIGIYAQTRERLDGILMAEQAIGKYALDIQGLRECRNLHQEAYIFYENAALDSYTIRTTNNNNFDEQSFKIAENGHHCHRILKNVICSLDLKNAKLSQLEEKADETIYVPFDANTFSFFTDEMTDNSYNFYISRYYPAYLSLQKGAIRIPQINGMSFKYPPSPILSQPENTLEKSVCSLDKRSKECADTLLFCECLQLLQVPPRKTIEIILINKGFGGNASYTFHLHGYNASVVARESFEQPLTKDDIISLDFNGKIHRNLVNPVQKDTFVVPNKGYIILRFYTDNLGYWLWEARSTAVYPPLLGPGMQFLMRVGLQRNLPLVPIDFPSCGNKKGIDMIFES